MADYPTICLTRTIGKAILIGPDVRVEVVRITRGSVRLAITAPRAVKVLREELLQERQE